jgi:prohibitin 1
MKQFAFILLGSILLSSCAVVRPGQVGVRTTFGKFNGEPKNGGLLWFNPFTSSIEKVPIRTINRELTIDLPSKEGLTIRSDISILYHIKPEMVQKVIAEIGTDYDKIITAVFRSASADVCAKYFAKDMHSGIRDGIEREITEKMNSYLKDRGFVIEYVLLKSIILPPGLARAIEDKLEAEQQAQRMEFVLIQEEKEAERKRIEAEGTRKAQKIVSDGLTPEILKLRSIEVLRDLAKSPNAKVIVTDGKTPVIMAD